MHIQLLNSNSKTKLKELKLFSVLKNNKKPFNASHFSFSTVKINPFMQNIFLKILLRFSLIICSLFNLKATLKLKILKTKEIYNNKIKYFKVFNKKKSN